VRIGGDYIVFVFFFFLPFALDFDIAALGSVVAVGAVASDPDFAAAPPLVPLAPPVCAKAPAADKASAMAATGMISARRHRRDGSVRRTDNLISSALRFVDCGAWSTADFMA
jgi:hypothetical protein